MKTLEEIRNTPNLIIRDVGTDGGAGVLYFGRISASVIWSFGGGWEHVSVCPFNRRYIPSWNDMCRVKDMFFRDDEAVIQIHPQKTEYVNNMPNCLHLWRCTCAEQPLPPSYMVGLKKGQTLADVMREIRENEGEQYESL